MGRPAGAKNKQFAGRPKSDATKRREARDRKRVRRRAAFEDRVAWRQEAKAINKRDKWLGAKNMLSGGDEHRRKKAAHELAKGGNKTVFFDGRGNVEVNGDTYKMGKEFGSALRLDDAAKLAAANAKEKKFQDAAQKKMDKEAERQTKKDEALLKRVAKKQKAYADKQEAMARRLIEKEEQRQIRDSQRRYAKEVAYEKAYDRYVKSLQKKSKRSGKIPKGRGGGKKGKAKKPKPPKYDPGD